MQWVTGSGVEKGTFTSEVTNLHSLRWKNQLCLKGSYRPKRINKNTLLQCASKGLGKLETLRFWKSICALHKIFSPSEPETNAGCVCHTLRKTSVIKISHSHLNNNTPEAQRQQRGHSASKTSLCYPCDYTHFCPLPTLAPIIFFQLPRLTTSAVTIN